MYIYEDNTKNKKLLPCSLKLLVAYYVKELWLDKIGLFTLDCSSSVEFSSPVKERNCVNILVLSWHVFFLKSLGLFSFRNWECPDCRGCRSLDCGPCSCGGYMAYQAEAGRRHLWPWSNYQAYIVLQIFNTLIVASLIRELHGSVVKFQHLH